MEEEEGIPSSREERRRGCLEALKKSIKTGFLWRERSHFKKVYSKREHLQFAQLCYLQTVRPGAEVLFIVYHPVRHFPSSYGIRTAAHHIRLNLDCTHEKAHTFACSLHKKAGLKSSRIPFPWQCILPYHAH